MARRKGAFLSDGSDSDDSHQSGSEGGYNSQEDADSRAERALFEYNGSKRRKMAGRGKASAWEGIFGEEEEQDTRMHTGIGAGSSKGTRSKGARSDMSKAPSFVTGHVLSPKPANKANSPAMEEDINSDEADSDDPAESSDGQDTASSFLEDTEVARNREDDLDQDQDAEPSTSQARKGLGARLGIGARGGLGSSRSNNNNEDQPGDSSDQAVPDRPRQRFVAQSSTPAPVIKQTELTAEERRHFQSIKNDFGAKLLQKFGWSAGEGLGKDRSGRAVPIAVGKHLRGQGISSGIRSEDSKREARRKGEKISDDEDDERQKTRRMPKDKKSTQTQEQSWRKQRKVKVKVEHKTYEQLVAEAGESSNAGVGLVLDARGGELREVQSLSALDLSGWTPTAENAQIPELRHNLRLVVDVTKGEVEALAREGRTVNEKRRWAQREQEVARAKHVASSEDITRIQHITDLVNSISRTVASQIPAFETSLAPFASLFDKLLNDYPEEYLSLDLDDVIVGAITQVTRPILTSWEPFDESSDALLSALLPWKHAYRLSENEQQKVQGRGMTAWETLLWSLWLPKVRSAINNHWSAKQPQVAIHLLESWRPLLPSFIMDNVLDQLILPKLRQSIEEWDGRPSRSGKHRTLSGMVFPWLPILGHRLPDILEASKRKLRSFLRKWVVRDGVSDELTRWRKDIFANKEWDELMLRSVIPKLGTCLRDDFQVNPRQQEMQPLRDWVLPWGGLIRSSTFAQLLEVNFFPKWLDILYIWLVQPNFKADEVANWFTWWKAQFPQSILQLPGVAHGFTAGLDLMQQAMRLGEHAPVQLRKPVFEPLKSSKAEVRRPTVPIRPETAESDITFRTLAEEFATNHDLVFFPTGRSHTQSGKPLFKVSKTANGRGGITVYIGDAAVFALGEEGTFRAVTLEDMVKLASV